MKRREFVALLGGAAAFPLVASAQQPGSSAFDPRITPARGDLAARHLAGIVKAQRYVEGKLYEVGAAQVPMHGAPSHEAELSTQALKGEFITIYEIGPAGSGAACWAWGQLTGDGYVGYVPAAALRALGPPPTHKVSALRTFVYPGPSFKRSPIETLSFGCRLAIERIDGAYAITPAGGNVWAGHLAPIETMECDFVAVAERFVGTPYLWGGKSFGVDCSGLLQLALRACGVPCPRDTDMQEHALGSALAYPHEQLRRGDLLFWKGHVAIVRDEATLVHANAHHMAVAIEPTASAIERIRAEGSEVTSARRFA